MNPDDVRRILGTDPIGTALLFDFDGTLSPLVDDPASAIAAPGARELLSALATRFGRVAVVSGRPLSFLESHFDPQVDLSAVYGLHTRVDGVVREHPDSDQWRKVISAVVADNSAPDGLGLESKGVSLTIHYREDPDREAEAVAWARAVGERTGLEVRVAKASFELHPPIPVTKGHSVQDFAEGCRTVAFVGDDVGDLPAFAAVDALAGDGLATVKVACGGDELPMEVARAVDIVVPDPQSVIDLFAPLAELGDESTGQGAHARRRRA